MLNFALIGCGSMAHAHMPHFQKLSDRARVVALIDPIAERTREFRQKYFADAAEFSSIEGLFAATNLKLDAVLLVTPHYLHFPHAMMALERGLHVLTEKPMVTSSEHAYELWRAVKRSGKLLGIAFQSAYTAEFGYLAEARDNGTLGNVRMISGWMSQNWLKATSGTWRQIPEQSGGGQMYDSGSHLLNAIMWIMNLPVVEVACFYDRCGSPVDINGVAIAKFQNGTLASVSIGGACPQFRTDIQIQAENFLIHTDQYGRKLEMDARDGKKFYPHVKQDLTLGAAAGTPLANFIGAIEGKEPLRAPVRYGVLLSALMDALYESAAKQQVVKVRAVPEEI